MHIKNKVLSVVCLSLLQENSIAIEPFAVKKGIMTSYTGRNCNYAAVFNKQSWEEYGHSAFFDLFNNAPWPVDNRIQYWQSVRSDTLQPIRRLNAMGYINNGILTKAQINPSWSPYLDSECFRFNKIPPAHTFYEHINRLLIIPS